MLVGPLSQESVQQTRFHEFVLVEVSAVIQVETHTGTIIKSDRYAHAGSSSYVFAKTVVTQLRSEVRYQVVG